MIQETWKISGMSCQHCVMSLQKELAKIPGITVESVEIGSAHIKREGQSQQKSEIEKAIIRAGFESLGTTAV
jgi:copper chaperone CopZ